MKGVKDMLLGLSIMLAVVVFHLFVADGLWTDAIALCGLALVLAGYFRRD